MLLAMLAPCALWGQSLTDTLTAAYKNNPALKARRAQLRATDELLPQALSSYWPQLNLTFNEGRTKQKVATTQSNRSGTQITDETLTDRNLALAASLNLYAGGADEANVNYASAVIAAGRAQWLNTQQQVLSQAAEAYIAIVYFNFLVQLSKLQEEDLNKLKEMTDSLYSNQLATVTDANQVDADLENSRFQYDAAVGELKTAQAQYYAVVNEPAPVLDEWPTLPEPPGTLDETLELAQNNNPKILFAEMMYSASQYALRINEATLLPVVDLYSRLLWEWDRTRYTQSQDFIENDFERAWSVGIQVTVPLYQGGENYSRVRQAKQTIEQQRYNLLDTRYNTEQQVQSGLIALNTAHRQLMRAHAEVKFATAAYDGLQWEFKNGSVTMSDVLTGQTNLITARSNVYEATFDKLNATIGILVAVGRFRADRLNIQAPLYDPDEHLREVRNKRFGLGE